MDSFAPMSRVCRKPTDWYVSRTNSSLRLKGYSNSRLSNVPNKCVLFHNRQKTLTLYQNSPPPPVQYSITTHVGVLYAGGDAGDAGAAELVGRDVRGRDVRTELQTLRQVGRLHQRLRRVRLCGRHMSQSGAGSRSGRGHGQRVCYCQGGVTVRGEVTVRDGVTIRAGVTVGDRATVTDRGHDMESSPGTARPHLRDAVNVSMTLALMRRVIVFGDLHQTRR